MVREDFNIVNSVDVRAVCNEFSDCLAVFRIRPLGPRGCNNLLLR